MASPLATTLGGASNTARLKKLHPEMTSLSLDYYLLAKPLSAFLNCVDPEITNSEQLKTKAKLMAEQLRIFSSELEKIAA